MFYTAYTAYAAEASSNQAEKPNENAAIFSNIGLFVLIFLIFYFVSMRPQQKKAKEHQSMVEALKKGDSIISSGGIIATVVKIESDGETVTVEISPDVKIKLMKSSIIKVNSKTTNK